MSVAIWYGVAAARYVLAVPTARYEKTAGSALVAPTASSNKAADNAAAVRTAGTSTGAMNAAAVLTAGVNTSAGSATPVLTRPASSRVRFARSCGEIAERTKQKDYCGGLSPLPLPRDAANPAGRSCGGLCLHMVAQRFALEPCASICREKATTTALPLQAAAMALQRHVIPMSNKCEKAIVEGALCVEALALPLQAAAMALQRHVIPMSNKCEKAIVEGALCVEALCSTK